MNFDKAFTSADFQSGKSAAVKGRQFWRRQSKMAVFQKGDSESAAIFYLDETCQWDGRSPQNGRNGAVILRRPRQPSPSVPPRQLFQNSCARQSFRTGNFRWRTAHCAPKACPPLHAWGGKGRPAGDDERRFVAPYSPKSAGRS